MRAGAAETLLKLSSTPVRLGSRFILESASDRDAVAKRIGNRSATYGD